MNRKQIQVITILTCLALAGLIAIQLYWINNAFKLNEQKFEQSVSEALKNVANKLEKSTAAAKITKRFNLRKQGIRFLSGKEDSSARTVEFFIDSLRTQDQKDKKIKIKIYEESSADSNGVVIKKSRQKDYFTDSLKSSEFSLDLDLDDNGIMQFLRSDSMEQNFKWMKHRSDVVKDIFDELISINIYNDFNENLDTLLLDSLINAEFKDHGIKANYEFGIISHPEGNTQNNSATREKLLASGFKVNLSPENVFIQPRFLSVYFPHQKNYILNTMWLMLICSALLVFALIFSFYYSISTILKQKKMSQIKNDFISNMTHEFKTPVSTISLACEVLNDSTVVKSPEKVKNYVEVISDENKRLSALVENIIQTSILDKGEFKLKLQKVDIHQIIDQAINNIRLQVENKEGEIVMKLHASDFEINADKVHVTNVIFNLIDNALKYTEMKPKIIVETQNIAGLIQIKIQDNGIGISKENQKRIFETLYRVPTGNVHNVKGYGLGLSYVKAVVEKHGGTVSVESELGYGSKFIVSFPIHSKL